MRLNFFSGIQLFSIIYFAFYVSSTLRWNVFAEMGTLCFSMPVFFKQRSLQMYPAWAFALPAAILRLPFSIIDATLFTAIMYFPTGLAPQASRFFIFWGFHILFSQTAVGMFRFIAALGRTFEVANSYGNLVVILQMILSGFVMTRTSIHDWWIWVSACTSSQSGWIWFEDVF
jgi:ABC-type multidrug transport system permease subunit